MNSRSAYLFTAFLLILIISPATAQPVKLIYDADMESDVDDVGYFTNLSYLLNSRPELKLG